MQPTPTASYSLTLRIKLSSRAGSLGELTMAIGRAGGDIETVKLHLKALKQSKLEDALELYRLLGTRSLKLTKKHPQITQMTQILKSV